MERVESPQARPTLGEIEINQFAPYLMNSIATRWVAEMADALKTLNVTTEKMRALAQPLVLGDHQRIVGLRGDGAINNEPDARLSGGAGAGAPSAARRGHARCRLTFLRRVNSARSSTRPRSR
jgi:hypothetical protein